MTSFEAQGHKQSRVEKRIAAPLGARQLGQVGHGGVVTELCNHCIMTRKATSAPWEDASTTSNSTNKQYFQFEFSFSSMIAQVILIA